jgi:hypothetical protein
MNNVFKSIVNSTKFEGTEDGLGFVISTGDKAAAVTGKTLKIAILQDDDNKEVIVVGYIPTSEEESSAAFGLIIYEDGTITLNGKQVKIIKTEFNTHEEAVNTLETGEEYYIAGDNGVYRKV